MNELPHLTRVAGAWSATFVLAVTAWLVLLFKGAAMAQDTSDQYGGQQRADAAAQLIVLAVQQAISSLPPTSGQSLTYEYDPTTLTFVADSRLGPTAFLSANTIGKGKGSFRFATSYFDLDHSFDPIDYLLEPVGGFGRFGLHAEAQVALFNLSANYGLTHRWELNVNLPITIVNAQARQSFSTDMTALGIPADRAPFAVVTPRQALQTLLDTGDLVMREETFGDLGFKFDSGTAAGFGRAGIGAKGVLYANPRFRFAAAPQFFFPSPSQDEFAGPDSAAILPRVVGQARAAEFLTMHADLGYDYDFETSALRRFVWNVGAAYPTKGFSIDIGVGGSEYETPIRWTPSVAQGRTGSVEYVVTAQEDNEVGTSFVDFRGGIKLRLTDRFVLSGAVTVPLNNEGFRPAALGTLALEAYL